MIRVDYDEYLKQYPNVRAWMHEYKSQSIATFEPLVRNYLAIKANGEIAKFLGKDVS